MKCNNKQNQKRIFEWERKANHSSMKIKFVYFRWMREVNYYKMNKDSLTCTMCIVRENKKKQKNLLRDYMNEK